MILDAPADVLYARKAEHPVEVLERWRRGYREVLVPKGACVVSTDAPLDESVARTLEVIWGALADRRGWTRSGT